MRTWVRLLGLGGLAALIATLVMATQLASIWDFFARRENGAERVAQAYREKVPVLERRFRAAGTSWPPRRVFLRALKDERVIELWASERAGGPLSHVHDYAICNASGVAGPKRTQGDRQVPEGFYTIDRFHPQSRHFLSLGLSYPNASDRARARGRPGGDIFIHGGCGSIGCLAVGDDRAREIYVALDAARRAGQARIPVHVFPARMSDARAMAALTREHPEHAAFWNELREGWRIFDRTHVPPEPRVDARGRYRFGTP